MGSEYPRTDFPLEGVNIRPAVSADCYELAPELRPADTRECLANGLDPLDALLQGLALGVEVFTVCHQDEPVMMFGCGDAPTNLQVGGYDPGVIWMLSTPKVFEFKRLFLRQSREWVEYFQNQHDCLTNIVDVRNTVHHRWLVWMGFHILQPAIEYGSNSFYRFVRFPCAYSLAQH